MNKITITNLVDFSRKSSRGKQTLVNKLKAPKKNSQNEDGGGDYWISALSCLSREFVDNQSKSISKKIDELIDKIESHDAQRTKDMYQRNINILQNFEDFDFSTLKPKSDLTYLKKPKEKSIVEIVRVPLYVKVTHVFTFEEDGKKSIGAVWFVAKLNGLKDQELYMVCDLLHRYLNSNYSENYEISTNHCIAIDVNNIKTISYGQLLNENIKSSLIDTVNEFKKLM